MPTSRDEIKFQRRTPLRPRLAEQLHDGDWVCDISNPKRLGQIVKAGPVQSEIRWKNGGPANTHGVDIEINRYLKETKGNHGQSRVQKRVGRDR